MTPVAFSPFLSESPCERDSVKDQQPLSLMEQAKQVPQSRPRHRLHVRSASVGDPPGRAMLEMFKALSLIPQTKPRDLSDEEVLEAVLKKSRQAGIIDEFHHRLSQWCENPSCKELVMRFLDCDDLVETYLSQGCPFHAETYFILLWTYCSDDEVRSCVKRIVSRLEKPLRSPLDFEREPAESCFRVILKGLCWASDQQRKWWQVTEFLEAFEEYPVDGLVPFLSPKELYVILFTDSPYSFDEHPHTRRWASVMTSIEELDREEDGEPVLQGLSTLSELEEVKRGLTLLSLSPGYEVPSTDRPIKLSSFYKEAQRRLEQLSKTGWGALMPVLQVDQLESIAKQRIIRRIVGLKGGEEFLTLLKPQMESVCIILEEAKKLQERAFELAQGVISSDEAEANRAEALSILMGQPSVKDRTISMGIRLIDASSVKEIPVILDGMDQEDAEDLLSSWIGDTHNRFNNWEWLNQETKDLLTRRIEKMIEASCSELLADEDRILIGLFLYRMEMVTEYKLKGHWDRFLNALSAQGQLEFLDALFSRVTVKDLSRFERVASNSSLVEISGRVKVVRGLREEMDDVVNWYLAPENQAASLEARDEQKQRIQGARAKLNEIRRSSDGWKEVYKSRKSLKTHHYFYEVFLTRLESVQLRLEICRGIEDWPIGRIHQKAELFNMVDQLQKSLWTLEHHLAFSSSVKVRRPC